MNSIVISDRAITSKRRDLRPILSKGLYGIKENLESESGLFDIVVNFVATYQTVAEVLNEHYSKNDKFVNSYATFIAAEACLEDLVEQDLTHVENGQNLFSDREVDFGEGSTAMRLFMVNSLGQVLSSNNKKPGANTLFDYFSWLSLAARDTSDSPEIEALVRGAYASKITLEGPPKHEFSGYERKDNLTIPEKKDMSQGWDHVGGYEEAKVWLKRWTSRLKRPKEYYESRGGIAKHVPSAFLLVGPPGTGKTTMANLFARMSGLDFYEISLGEIASTYKDGTALALQRRIDDATRAVKKGYKKGSVIFIDEIEVVVPQRSSQNQESGKNVNILNLAMSGKNQVPGVIYVAATNHPEMMDWSQIRSGRFGYVINLGIPNDETLGKVYESLIGRINTEVTEYLAIDPSVSIADLVKASSNEPKLKKLAPGHQVLLREGVLFGEKLDAYTEVASQMATGERLPFHQMTTGADVGEILSYVFSEKCDMVEKTGGIWSPITTKEIIEGIQLYKTAGKK